MSFAIKLVQDTRFLLILSIVFLAYIPKIALCQPKITQHLIKSTVLLRNAEGICGSGFIVEGGLIYTNAHVVESLCPAADCTQVSVYFAEAIGQRATQRIDGISLRLKTYSAMLDFAVLESNRRELGGFTSYAIDADKNSDVFALGFPGCSELTLSQGKVYENQPLRLYTSTQGKHGSSGSPIFDSNFSLIGIVNQSSTIGSGLASLSFGSSFENRAVPFTTVKTLESLDKRQALIYELKLLAEFHKTTVRIQHGRLRMREDLELTQRLQSVIDEALHSDIDLSEMRPLFALDRDLFFLASLQPNKPLSDLQEAAELLFVVQNVETRGMRNRFFAPLEVDAVMNKLMSPYRSNAHLNNIRELLQFAAKDNYPGLLFFSWIFFALIFVVLGILLFFWAASSGYVFARANGSVSRRLFTSVLVALLFWPLSFIYFCYKRRRKPAPQLK